MRKVDETQGNRRAEKGEGNMRKVQEEVEK
jgi:hypothetical protein